MDAPSEPGPPCSCISTTTLGEGSAIGRLFYYLVASGPEDLVPEPDGSGVGESGCVNILGILEKPGCEDTPKGRDLVGGILARLCLVKELYPPDFPDLAPASTSSIRVLRSPAMHMVLGSQGDDSKLLGQSLRRGSYFNEGRILLLLQWLIGETLQGAGSPVPMVSPASIWAMKEEKVVSLKRFRNYLLEAKDLPGPSLN